MRLEFQPADVQEQFQLQALNTLRDRLLLQSRFYSRQWQHVKAAATPLRSLQDLQYYPCTSKEDIQQSETDFYCADRQLFREFNTTSGTLGQPIAIPVTEKDLDRLAYNEMLSFEKLGVHAGTGVQLMLTMDRLFMAGMAYYGGLRKAGATAIRTGAGMPQLQWDAIERYRPDTLVAVPSFLLKMLDYADAHHIPYLDSGIRNVLAIGESLKDELLQPNALYHKIKDRWDITLHNTYASTEMQTAFTECIHGCGGHQHTELLVAEIVDEQGMQVPEGSTGEVCITTLGVEGMPLWRYRTGDMARMYYEPCSCGRLSPRISGITGRKKHMLKVKGTTLYPAAIFDALNGAVSISDYVVEAYTNTAGQDDIRIFLCAGDSGPDTARQVSGFLQAKLRITPALFWVDDIRIRELQFPETGRKQVKFIDNRINGL